MIVHGIWECPDCRRQVEVKSDDADRLFVLIGCVKCDKDLVEVS